jgi:hypothetical protein
LVVKQGKDGVVGKMPGDPRQVGGGGIKMNPQCFNRRIGGEHQRQVVVPVIQRQPAENGGS